MNKGAHQRRNEMALTNSGDGTETQRTVLVGKPSDIGTNNSIYTSKYTIWTFFPLVSDFDGHGRRIVCF